MGRPSRRSRRRPSRATRRRRPGRRTSRSTRRTDVAARVRDAGGNVIAAPSDRFGLATTAICADPAGAVFGLWEPGSIRGAGSVNAPGTWNFSELNTDDVEGATRFYASVFGWEVSEVDMGAMKGTMVRLPGYADFLEQVNPGTKQRHIDFGAPPGFTECVAWFLPLGEGAMPHWSLTISVADADAVAAKARELGGSVDGRAARPADGAQHHDPRSRRRRAHRERLQSGLIGSFNAVRRGSGAHRSRVARGRRTPRRRLSGPRLRGRRRGPLSRRASRSREGSRRPR